MRKLKNNIVGTKRGMLEILSIKDRVDNDYLYECKCDCGNTCVKRGTYLARKSKAVKNCGCLYFYNGNKVSKKPLYRVYRHILQRCHLKYNDRHSKYYQDKGIKVCDEWKNNYLVFEKWALENGYQKGLTIDRINPNDDYKPSNCRFITINENSRRIERKKGVLCLSQTEKEEIYIKRDNGYKLKDLAIEHNVSLSTIKKLLYKERKGIL